MKKKIKSLRPFFSRKVMSDLRENKMVSLKKHFNKTKENIQTIKNIISKAWYFLGPSLPIPSQTESTLRKKCFVCFFGTPASKQAVRPSSHPIHVLPIPPMQNCVFFVQGKAGQLPAPVLQSLPTVGHLLTHLPQQVRHFVFFYNHDEA